MGFLQRFMAGRNGPDNISITLFLATVVLYLLNGFLQFGVLSILSLILFGYCMFRMMSKNIVKRRAEDAKFMNIFSPVKEFFKQKIIQIKSSKTHKFFKCPSCKNVLRVPRGKGKIHITCPKCGQRFDGKT